MQGMSLLRRFEAKFGPWAIPNLTLLLIAGQVLVFFLQTMRAGQGVGSNLLLLPSAVVGGEVWRIITFVFIPPRVAPLFVIFFWMLFYRYGTSLEQHWGAVRYNVFLLIGYLANVAAVFLAWGLGSDIPADNKFLYGTLFLAFARLYPNYVIHLFFILPIQIKWLALLAWIGYGYGLITGTWMDRMLIVASLLNYLLFFGREHWREMQSGHRRREFQSRTKAAKERLKHQCLVCGLNSKESPKTLFRYCSKCDGQCCYCPEHIQDHEHVLADDSSLAGAGKG